MNKQIQGKKNRQAGQRFELKVRKDLESKGWIVDKWSNNVQLAGQRLGYLTKKSEKVGAGTFSVTKNKPIEIDGEEIVTKLIPARHKFRGSGIPMAIGTGFPDFIAYKGTNPWLDIDLVWMENVSKENQWKSKIKAFGIIGVEAKSNGYLSKEEKEKIKWLLDNHIFSKILIARKSKKRGEIVYEEMGE